MLTLLQALQIALDEQDGLAVAVLVTRLEKLGKKLHVDMEKRTITVQ